MLTVKLPRRTKHTKQELDCGVKPKVSCTRQTSLLQGTKSKFNKDFKWIILDKNSGTNHMGKYIESLSF